MTNYRPFDNLRRTAEGNRKLSQKEASEIRLRHINEKMSGSSLAREYKVTEGVIRGILSGRTYSPVPHK